MKVRSKKVLDAAGEIARVMASNNSNAWENLAALRVLLQYGELSLSPTHKWWLGYKCGMFLLSALETLPKVTKIPAKWRIFISMGMGTETRIIEEFGEEWSPYKRYKGTFTHHHHFENGVCTHHGCDLKERNAVKLGDEEE
jgi:hypothetical protein